jgi:Cu/Zn superoxide dismutase
MPLLEETKANDPNGGGLAMRIYRSTIGVSGIFCAALIGTAATAALSAENQNYTAELHALNSTATGSTAAGESTFTIDGGKLTIAVDASGLPPDMMHLQHFHGFKDGRAASCPDAAADKNGDGVIDLIETEAYAGTTMVPFHNDPVSMAIPSDTYPKANADGSYKYEKTVPLKDLQAAFAKAFGSDDLALDRRVVFIHGVPDKTDLPESAASLGTIPAQITLPIACGVIERAE